MSCYSQQQKMVSGFLENSGQIIDQTGKKNDKVLYLLNTNGLNVQLRNGGFSYDVYEMSNQPDVKKLREGQFGDRLKYNFQRVDIDFLDCNKDVVVTASGKSADYDNYYTVPDTPNGVLHVHKYEKVTYQNIYPNVDVVFFTPNDRTKPVEYNFIIRPGGRVSDIKMRFNGASTNLIDNKIRMKLRFGIMEETLPLSWEDDGGNRKEAKVSYTKIKNNLYGFSAINDPQKTLVIDPTPERLWGTYYGGNADDYPSDIVHGSDNSVYMSGITTSQNNIATTGSLNQVYFIYNGFVVKFNANGQRQWGIYYTANPKTLNVDANNNVYFAGQSSSVENNVTTPGSHQPVSVGMYNNAFLVKLNSSGVREWGTFYGGDSFTDGTSLCFDTSNNVYMAGKTESSTHIATPGTHQTQYGGGRSTDGFITKFSPSGTQIWGTYYGGTENDDITSIVLSEDNFLYVVGNTLSPTGIATPNGYISNYTTGRRGLLAKINLNGQRIWGSYFGKEGYTDIKDSAINGNSLYFFGITNNTDLLSTGTFMPNYQKLNFGLELDKCSYIAKFDVAAIQQVWGTYFYEYIQDIAVNRDSYPFIVGSTSKSVGIATPNAYQTQNTYGEAYIIKFSPTGQRVWGTYYGGNGKEDHFEEQLICNKISIDSNNDICITGDTQESTQGIASVGAHQTSYGSTYRDAFIAKFSDCDTPVIAGSNSPVCIGSTIELTASGGTSYSWTGPGGFSSALQNPTITNAGLSKSGVYQCTVTGNGKCDGIVIVDVTVGDAVAPVPDNPNLPRLTGDCNTISIPFPTATDNCKGVITGTTSSPLSYATSGDYSIVWDYVDDNNNSYHQTQQITITAQPLPIAEPDQSFCFDPLLTLADIAISGEDIKWYDSLTGGNILLLSSPLVNGGIYYASQTLTGCESKRIPVTVSVQSTTKPLGASEQLFCNDQHPTLQNFAINGSIIVFYDEEVGGSILPLSTMLVDGQMYWAAQTANGCESPERLGVKATIVSEFSAENYNTSICDTSNDGQEKVNLMDYNVFLVENSTNYSFSYYKSLSAAQDGSDFELIANAQEYNINIGKNIVYARVSLNSVCHQVVLLKFELIPSPEINLKETYSICENATVTISANGIYDSYDWSTGAKSSSITIYQPGNYWLTVTKDTGEVTCSNKKNFAVVLSNKPVIKTVHIRDWTDNNNTIVILTTETGNYEYSLDGIQFQDSNYFDNLTNGKYLVYVRDKDGCGTASKEIFLLTYPKFFTPNQDGKNDLWKIEFSFWEPGLNVQIFDRYGKLIKSLTHKDSGWDGTFKGNKLPSTDYWFVVNRADGSQQKGHFSMIR